MHAVILAAGMGRRLGAYTRDNTKCMVPLDGVTLIERALGALEEAGIRRATLVVGYQRENLRRFLGDRFRTVELRYVENPDFERTNNIYSLYLAREHLLEDDTLLLESDIVFDPALLRRLVADPRPNLVVVDRFQSWMDGTAVTLGPRDQVTGFVPKAAFDFARVGEYFKTVNISRFGREFSRRVYVPFLEAYQSALGQNEYYEQVLRVISLLDQHDLHALVVQGERWYEIDTPEDRENAETLFAPSPARKLELVQRRHGGYWRFPHLVDFCYLVNPHFPPPRLRRELETYALDVITRYPSSLAVCSGLAAGAFGLDPSQVVAGNGAAELIARMPDVLDGRLGMVVPTFDEYPRVFGADRCVVDEAQGDDLACTRAQLEQLGDDAQNVLLVNPDNPTGRCLPRAEVVALAETLARRGRRLVLDESFVDFSTEGASGSLLSPELLDRLANVVVVRSLGKSHGIAGLRLGLVASGDRALVRRLREALPVWNIGSLAEFFLQNLGKYGRDFERACDRVREGRAHLAAGLAATGYLRPLPSEANFVTCEVLAPHTASGLTERLLWAHDVFVKDLTGKRGTRGRQLVRIAVRDEADHARLFRALAAEAQ